ncbi:MAG: translesion DNA synthesis-associated protein ImuA [Gammaproteobacteria bacterium]|nr:translesion DNA synthesis-associated protein ImuA [Gammaproteobacteria bacterium]
MSTQPMNTQLQTLLENNPQIWRAKDAGRYQMTGTPTGHPQLDATLPGGGWPGSAIMEMVTPQWGMGELQLLLPLMRSITQQKRWILWISPPYVPYAPALERAGIDMDYVIVIQPDTSCKDALWSIEKALQTRVCALVLAWLNWLPNGVIRRLQLAAEEGHSLGVLFRQHNDQHSPAALRLQLHPSEKGVHVEILKARGTYHYRSVHVNLQLH